MENKKEKLRVLSLFSGIGAPEKALNKLGVRYNLVNYCEIDKYAANAYSAIHNENEDKNLGDITKVDIEKLPTNIDLLTHGSPCQDFSVAGKQAGGDKGTNTRSSLLWNSVEIIKHCKPNIVIWENVKNVLSKKHKHNFDKYLNTLENIGYINYYQVLNAKDYGIPQNRERVFCVSILNNTNFKFPTKKNYQRIPLDFVDEEVNSSFNLTEKNKKHYQRDFGSKGKELDMFNPIPTLTASMGTGGGNVPYFKFPTKTELELKLKDISDETDGGKICPYCIKAFNKEYDEIINSKKPIYQCNVKSGFQDCKVGITLSPTLRASNHNTHILQEQTIRKLTPLECWRLMGFEDNDFYKAKQSLMDTFYKGKDRASSQLYKMAGNSIVVNVLEAIFKELFINKRR